MGTKAQIQASNDSIRGDVDLITPDEDCDNRDLLLNNFYGTTVKDSQATETYTDAVNGSSFPYSVNLRKQGGITHAEVRFTTTTGGSNQKLFYIKDTGEYAPEVGTFEGGINPVIRYFKAYDEVNNVEIRCKYYDDGTGMVVRAMGSIPALSSSTWYFEFDYNNAS